MTAFITIFKEQISSIYLILRLSAFELKSANTNNYLGRFWEILNPMIQLAIYWFIFGVGVRKGHDVILENKVHAPFLIWMITGMIVWFFINPAISASSRSIYTRINLIAKMSFPMSAIPSFVIMAYFYTHLLLVGIVTIILQFTKFKMTIYFIQLPYFMLAALFFLLSLSLITSTLSTIVRDVQQIVQSILKMMLYITPLLWHIDKFMVNGHNIGGFLKFNPLWYLVEGYRASLLGTGWYWWHHPNLTIYFWVFCFVLFIIGSSLHLKFRSRFVDYL